MALTGYILSENGRENIECYSAGTNGGLTLGIVDCAPDGIVQGLDWALPCSTNGVSLTGFDYQRAVGAFATTKPRADAVKVLTIQNIKNGGGWKRVIVPDAYTISTFNTACCAGCTPIADVTVPAPILFVASDCVITPPAVPACVWAGDLYIQALTGANTTWTVTAYGYTADGTPIVFAPTTSTGTTVALLAANMQTNWAAETGSGTFVATGNMITYRTTNGATLGFTVAQS